MDRFVYVGHPLTVADIHAYFSSVGRGYKPKGKALTTKLVEWVPPFQVGAPVRVRSATGQCVEAIFTTSALLSEHFVRLPERTVLRKIVAAAKVGREHGAKLVGLGGFNSFAADHGLSVARELGVPVTNGHTFLAAGGAEGIRRAADLLGRDLAGLRLVVVGISEMAGACVRMLAKEVGSLVLTGAGARALRAWAEWLGTKGVRSAEVEDRMPPAVAGADVVLWATSALTIEPDLLRPGSMICDIGLPPMISSKVAVARPDVLAFYGGIVETPHRLAYGFAPPAILPAGTVPTCLAEVAVLALDGRAESFSIGSGEIEPERAEAIYRLATKHGFIVNRLRAVPKTYTHDDLAYIRQQGGADWRGRYAAP